MLFRSGGTVFIDAKFPFDSYYAGLSAETPEARADLMKAHAVAVAKRADELSKRTYHAADGSSPDFAVLFLPFESLLYEALEHEPNLLNKIFTGQVIIATPSTMLGLLHTIKLGTAQRLSAENAGQIRDAAVTLLDRFRVFAEHINKVDAGLNSARKAFDAAASSINLRVIPQIRTMEALGVTPPKAIPAISPGTIDHEVIEDGEEAELEA